MIIESGLVKAGLVKTGLVRAISNINTRYFRRNEGTTDGYETNARLIPSPLTHFDVEFQLLGDVDITGTFVSQNVSSTSSAREFQIFQNNQPVQVILGGAINTLATTLTSGVWRIKFDGVDIQVIKDGAVIETFTPSIGSLSEPSATFTMCMRHDGTNSTYGFHYEGVMANVVIRNTSDQITNDYLIDDNSDTLVDRVSGQNGTVINGNADDWGLFREFPTLWRGENLSVPPWDSVNQELPKA